MGIDTMVLSVSKKALDATGRVILEAGRWCKIFYADEGSAIIRCKDCKDFRRWIDTDTTFCDLTDGIVCEDDFCSRAERRTDG